MSQRVVLVIDDNPSVGEALSLLLSLRDISTLVATTPEAGLEMLEQHSNVGTVIADMNFSADTTAGAEGVTLFRAIRERHPELPVILLTAWTHLEMAVELVKTGAADYIGKPWDDRKLVATVENLLELSASARQQSKQRKDRRRRRAELEKRFNLCGIVYGSDATQRAVELACRFAPTDLPVLITGPNGAGKELIAEILHANSPVRDGPFIAVNCSAIPDDLVEAELFGAEAGAYTGAVSARAGRFERAAGGTLLLDEIGNLPLASQAKLLRVLETGDFERLGGEQTNFMKTRVLASTNADLPGMIAAGTFREDLYYRLNVMEIPLAPLSARMQDIEPLAVHFLAGRAELSSDAMQALRSHDWPGNVRELRNSLERALLLSGNGPIEREHLNLPAQRKSSSPRSDDLDRATIEAALTAANGTVSHAARALGISRQALYRRMEKFGLASSSS